MLTDLPVVEGNDLHEVHDTASWFFLMIIVMNLLTHLFFLLRSVAKRAILYFKYRAFRRPNKTTQAVEKVTAKSLQYKVEEDGDSEQEYYSEEDGDSEWEYYSEEEED